MYENGRDLTSIKLLDEAGGFSLSFSSLISTRGFSLSLKRERKRMYSSNGDIFSKYTVAISVSLQFKRTVSARR